MSAIIRERRPDDLDGLISLLREVHDADGYPLLWPADPRDRLTLRGLLRAWVAEVQDALAGHAALCSAIDQPAGSSGRRRAACLPSASRPSPCCLSPRAPKGGGWERPF